MGKSLVVMIAIKRILLVFTATGMGKQTNFAEINLKTLLECRKGKCKAVKVLVEIIVHSLLDHS